MDRRKFLKLSTGATAVGALGISGTSNALLNCSNFNFLTVCT